MSKLNKLIKSLSKPKAPLTIAQKLDAKFGPTLEYIVSDYNLRHQFLEKGIGNKYDLSCHLRPIIVESGYTDCSKYKGAFELDPPAKIRSAPMVSADCHGIYRVSLSYEWAIRSLEKEDTKEFRLLVRTVLEDFSQQLGLSSDDDTVGVLRFGFKTPGRKIPEYFLELIDSAGFEFRIWTDCVNLSKIRKSYA